MKYQIKLIFIVCIFAALSPSSIQAQKIDMKLEEQMIALERDVVRIYNELQKFLYETNNRGNELLAFESLISIYVDEVQNLYDTFWRIKGTALESQQNIAARCLIFRALTYLERTQEDRHNYKKACDDYKKALRLSQNELKEPLLNTKIPHEVWVGRKLYTRLADLLDHRGKNFQMIKCFKMTNSTGYPGERR